MSARTSVPDLQEILETDLPPNILAAFINTAYQVVQDNLLNKGLSAGMLAEIEKYIAAHFASISRQRQEESEDWAGEYRVKYTGKTDMGWNATLYGQMALALDTTGTLRAMSLQVADFEVYATPEHGSSTRSL